MSAFTLHELQSMIVVNMGDFKTARGDKKLITKDLGSCVGIALRDSEAGVGGLLHIMLPQYIPDFAKEPFIASKYADTGIEDMVRVMIQQGAKKDRMTAKLAGAAHMFKNSLVPEESDISSRNIMAVKKKLAELGIPVLASDTGNDYPRTVVFELESGILRIITSGRADKTI